MRKIRISKFNSKVFQKRVNNISKRFFIFFYFLIVNLQMVCIISNLIWYVREFINRKIWNGQSKIYEIYPIVCIDLNRSFQIETEAICLVFSFKNVKKRYTIGCSSVVFQISKAGVIYLSSIMGAIKFFISLSAHIAIHICIYICFCVCVCVSSVHYTNIHNPKYALIKKFIKIFKCKW